MYDGSVDVTNYTEMTGSNNSSHRDLYCGSVDITNYITPIQNLETTNANKQTCNEIYEGAVPVTKYDCAESYTRKPHEEIDGRNPDWQKHPPVVEGTYDGAVDVTSYDVTTQLLQSPFVCLRRRKDPILEVQLGASEAQRRSLPVILTQNNNDHKEQGEKRRSVPQISNTNTRHSLHIEKITSI